MEKMANDMTKECCRIVEENNRQLQYILRSVEEMKDEVQDLKHEINQRDQLIKRLQSEEGERNQADNSPRRDSEATKKSGSTLYRND